MFYVIDLLSANVRRASLFVYFFLAIMMPALTIQVDGQDARMVARQVLPSVVLLETYDEKGEKLAVGSGFFVRSNVIATNYHVIKGASVAGIKKVGDTTTYWVGGVVGVDKTNDIALLSIGKTSGKPLTLVTDPTKMEIGQEIFALGNPQGLEATISPGIVSARGLRRIGQENLIQITAPISPGSSGGPVVNRTGQVVGMASGSLESGQNLNFAVPAAYIGILLAGSTKVISFSDWAESDLPTLEETSAWLVKVLSGYVDTVGETRVVESQLSLDRCKFDYRTKYSHSLSARFTSSNYSGSGSFSNFESLQVRRTPTGTPILVIQFSRESVYETRRWPTPPDFVMRDHHNYSHEIRIPLRDQDLTSEAIEQALRRVAGLCRRR